MESSAAGLLGFLMFMQLVFLLALLVGGLYALFALGRAASGLDRLASAVEDWVRHQENSAITNSSSTDTQSTLQSVTPMPDVSHTQSTPVTPSHRPTETHESLL